MPIAPAPSLRRIWYLPRRWGAGIGPSTWCRQPGLGQAHPHGGTQRNQVVVEVVARVVQHARPHAVAALAMRTVAVADQEITTTLALQEVTEVFGAHRRLEVVHVVRAHHVGEQ